jgi:fido (protein-threonine AMPylation protein)
MLSTFLLPYEKDFRKIVRDVDLVDGITTVSEYNRRIAVNLPQVYGKLESQKGMITDPDLILKLHGLLFRNVIRTAGQFATPIITVSGKRRPFRPYGWIVRPELAQQEFNLLGRQVRELEEYCREQARPNAGLEHLLIRTATFYVARFERIHALPDGNGRLGLMLLDHYLRQLTEQLPGPRIDRDTFIRCLAEAQAFGNLAPLSYALHWLFLGQEDSARYLPTPYRMEPQDASLPVETALARSRLEEASILEVKTIPVRRRWFVAPNADNLYLRRLELSAPRLIELSQHLQRTALRVGEVLMMVRDLQLTDPRISPSIAVRFVGELFETALRMMDHKSRKRVTDAWEDLYGSSYTLHTGYFDQMYQAAQYRVPQVPISSLRQPRVKSSVQAPKIQGRRALTL